MFDDLAPADQLGLIDRQWASFLQAGCVAGSHLGGKPDGSRVDQYKLPDMMVTNVCFGGRDLRTAFATLSMGGTLVSFEWPRPGLPLHYLNR